MDEKTDREKERKALFEKWDGPAANPRYRGQTPKEVARAALMRPRVSVSDPDEFRSRSVEGPPNSGKKEEDPR